MPTLMEQREKRANIWSNMTEILDRTESDPQGDDLQTYNRMDAELDKLDAAIQRGEKNERRGEAYNRVDRSGVAGGGEDEPDDEKEAAYSAAFNAYLMRGMGDLEASEKAVLNTRRSNLPRNAAGVGTGAAGGFAVPPLFRDKFVESMRFYGPVMDAVEVIRTSTGASLPWVTNDDTANIGAILAENTQVTEQDVTLGTASLDAYMYTSKLVRVSYQLMQDKDGFDTWLAGKLGQRVGRILNQHWTTGTGTSQPLGLITGGTVGVTGTGSLATTGGITGDNLIDLIEALDPAYGSSSGLEFMGHQSVRKALRKMKDTQGRYLWEISLQNGVPDSLMGYRFRLNNDMATLAVNSKSLAFGDFREGYVARIVDDLSTMRLNERYADFLQVGFLAFERAGGTVQNAAAYRVFQTTASA